MIQQTSIDSYHSLPIGKRQGMVLAQFKIYGDMTGQECADRLGRPINQVVGRISELVKEGYLCRKGEKMSKFNRTSIIWGLNINQAQQSFL